MLQLTKIHIKNFRSFRDVSFELKDLQLLIGPNNSGKSNLFRVFEYLRMTNNHSEAQKVDLNKIRFQHKEFQGEKKSLFDPVEITLEFKDTQDNTFLYFKSELYQISDPNNSFSNQFIGITNKRVVDEDFLKFDLQRFENHIKLFSEAYIQRSRTMSSGSDPLIDIETLGPNNHNVWSYTLTFLDDIIYFNQYNSQSYYSFPTGLYRPCKLQSYGHDIKNFFSQLIIYKPDTSFIKLAAEKYNNQSLISGNCRNIVSYLESLQSSNTKAFLKICEDLHSSIPDFTGYSFQTIEETLHDHDGEFTESMRYLRLEDSNHNYHLAEDISEGTLYFLMLIAIINQKDIPPILMLEEPETGIHPRRISEIMEYILILREKHPEISIILTTHHPYLVDHFNDMPHRVWVFEKENGETRMKNLERDVIEPLNRKIESKEMDPIDFSSSLGEHWTLGFLGGVPKPVVRG